MMPDFTSDELTKYIGTLIDTYLNVGWEVNNPASLFSLAKLIYS